MTKKPKGWLKSSWDTTQAINARIASRAERWNNLYTAGGGKVSDYIHADFNTQCPNGLNTKPWAADQIIKLESLFKSESFKNSGYFEKARSLKVSGWVQGDKDDIININPLWFSPLSLKLNKPLNLLYGETPPTMADIIPHEFIHTRQHYANQSGWLRNNSGNDIDYVGMNDLSKIRRIWRKTTRACHDITTIRETSSYYARNVEIQARMHEILAYGYAQWERLPTNKTQLWAALSNLGLKTPTSISETLNNTEEGQKALEDFKVLPSIKSTVSSTVSTFNSIHNYVGEKDVQEAIWQNKYPLLYGELIEFYGDELGRERLDMGTNPRPVIEVLYELNNHEGELTAADSERLAEKIPASLAAPFLNNFINYRQEGDDGFENAMHLSEALLARDDVKVALFVSDQTVRNYNGHFESPPLHMALIHGNVPMTTLLMKAGADPFQKFTGVDIRDKPLYVNTPISCVETVVIFEKNLADSTHLPRKAREYYKDPHVRENIFQGIKKIRAALEEVLRHSDDPDRARKLYNHDGSYEEVTLTRMMAKANVTEIKPERNNGPSMEIG